MLKICFTKKYPLFDQKNFLSIFKKFFKCNLHNYNSFIHFNVHFYYLFDQTQFGLTPIFKY